MENQVEGILDLLPRFEALHLTSFEANDGDDYTEPLKTDISMESSNILHLIAEEDPFSKYGGIIYRFKDKFQHFHTLYIVWQFYNYPMRAITEMVDDSWALFPSAKKINFYISYDWRFSYSELNESYNELVDNLRRIPKRFKVKMNFGTTMFGYMLRNRGHDPAVGRFFPSSSPTTLCQALRSVTGNLPTMSNSHSMLAFFTRASELLHFFSGCSVVVSWHENWVYRLWKACWLTLL